MRYRIRHHRAPHEGEWWTVQVAHDWINFWFTVQGEPIGYDTFDKRFRKESLAQSWIDEDKKPSFVVNGPPQ